MEDRRSVRHARQALLRRRGLTRRYDFLTTVSRYCNDLGWGNYANDHEDANGQFEQNFEYADALTRPATGRSSSATWCTRSRSRTGLIATFMPKPFTSPHRERRPHAHVAVAGRRGTCSPTTPIRAGSGSPSLVLPLHRRAEVACPRLECPYGADGELVQASQAGVDVERRDVVAGVDLLRLQQPHPDAAREPCVASYRGQDDRRLLQPLPRSRGGADRPASTESRRGLDAGEPNGENLYTKPILRLAHCAWVALRFPRRCSKRSVSSSSDDVLRASLGRAGATTTTSTTTPA